MLLMGRKKKVAQWYQVSYGTISYDFLDVNDVDEWIFIFLHRNRCLHPNPAVEEFSWVG